MSGETDSALDSLAFIGTSDVSGLLRGVTVPWTGLERLMGRGATIAGDVPLQMPFGTSAVHAGDDLVLLPDPATRAFVPVPDAPDLVLMLGDLLEPDGAPWECCPRYFLRRGLAALHAEAGLTLQTGFGQGVALAGPAAGVPHGVEAVIGQRRFGGALLARLRENGIAVDGFETGPENRQFRVVTEAQAGVGAADAAVLVRALARAVAIGEGRRASLAPGTAPGTAMRLCLRDEFGRPAMDDPAGEHGLTFEAEHWLAGVLTHMPAIAAVLAPSVASYGDRPVRMTELALPGRRGQVRLVMAGVEADRLEVEIAVADGASSPYLALGAVVWAGLDGVRRQLGLDSVVRAEMPGSLSAALESMAESVRVAEWFGPLFREVFLRFKREEIAALAPLDAAAVRARYREFY